MSGLMVTLFSMSRINNPSFLKLASLSPPVKMKLREKSIFVKYPF